MDIKLFDVKGIWTSEWTSPNDPGIKTLDMAIRHGDDEIVELTLFAPHDSTLPRVMPVMPNNKNSAKDAARKAIKEDRGE